VCEALSRKSRDAAPNTLVAQIEDFPIDTASVVDDAFCERVRMEFGLKERMVAVYTGNLEPYQGIDLLLESFAAAFSRLDDSDGPILLVLGGGELESESLTAYRKKSNTLGIGSRVRWLGSRPAEEMGSFMGLADLLVSPRTEGGNTPLKIYSYMAAGRPIAATRIDSHTQVLGDQNAFLAEPTPEAWAEMLKSALDSSAEAHTERRQRALAAKTLVEERYSKKEFSRRLLALYQQLIGVPAASQEHLAVVDEEPRTRAVC
jgi:glycosyltransferase involved in cell wall biosynthesis